MKTCSKCKTEQDESCFSRSLSNKDGLQFHCKSCAKFSHEAWRLKNPEGVKKVNERSKKYRLENPGKQKEYMREWRLENPGKQKEYMREWRLENPEKNKEYLREWRLENPGKQKEYSKKWCLSNPEKVRRRSKNWALKNPEKRLETQAKHTLLRQGFTKQDIEENSQFIAAKVTQLKIKRLIKNKQNGNNS